MIRQFLSHTSLLDITLVSSSFPVFDPATRIKLASVPNYGPVQVSYFILLAHEAFQSWKKTNGHERSVLLNTLFSLISTHEKDLATIITFENGKPFRQVILLLMVGVGRNSIWSFVHSMVCRRMQEN